MSEIDNLFDSINDAFNKPAIKGMGQSKNILRFEKGKDYVIRLLPYREDGSKTLFPFKYHGWKSISTGNYVEFIDPSMIGQPNPIKKYSFELGAKLKAAKLDKEHPKMKKARDLWTRNGWLFNCYVVDDPSNPENNGTVKILRVGAQIHDDVIMEAWTGDRKEDFGLRIFDLSPNGCNLKIRCTDNGGGYKDYTKSYFMNPSEIDEIGKDKDKIIEIWDQCFDLSSVYPIKSYDELKEALNVHFLGNVEGGEHTEANIDDIDDEEEGGFTDLDNLIDGDSEPEDEEEVEEVKKESNSKKKATSTKNKTSKSDEVDDFDSLIDNL